MPDGHILIGEKFNKISGDIFSNLHRISISRPTL